MANRVQEATLDLQAAIQSSRRARAAAFPQHTSEAEEDAALNACLADPMYLELSSDEDEGEDNMLMTDDNLSVCSTLSDPDEPEHLHIECDVTKVPQGTEDTKSTQDDDVVRLLHVRMLELDTLKNDMVCAVASTVRNLDAFICSITGAATMTSRWDGSLPLGHLLEQQLSIWALALHEWKLRHVLSPSNHASDLPQAGFSEIEHPLTGSDTADHTTRKDAQGVAISATETMAMMQEDCLCQRIHCNARLAAAQDQLACVEDERELLQLQVASMERRLAEALQQVALNLELAADQQQSFAQQAAEVERQTAEIQRQATDVERLRDMNVSVLEALILEDARLKQYQESLLDDEQRQRDVLLADRVALERFKRSMLQELIEICAALEVSPTAPDLRKRLRQACLDSDRYLYHAPSSA
ncbi:hypothetical protein ACHHYP_01454 [Achlya hypogyna]|uniref:Uncharacterized protein n=1 Tax=Achlya hypogyna TaxID=1202772 RepID=A0A1V9Z8M2_ACHHY|nr:hypothetical protein ACHHYP_01454 [Achlya hypogyna]